MALAIGLAALVPSTAQAASGLRPPAKASVSRATTDSITLRWKDRSRRESRYELSWVAPGGEPRTREMRRNAERARIGKLERGTVYDLELYACKRRRCLPARGDLSGATLLAPFGGPHPDPGCATFPAADEFNQPVAGAPRHPRSDAIIDQILADGGDALHPDFGSNPAYGIPYVVVPARQPEVPIRFTAYGDESDPGPYPVPPGAPVEGGSGADGDRHVLVVRRPATPGGSCGLFELYRAFERAGGRGWRADSAAFFDLGAPLAGQRPAGWTSADAAGLPIFPGLITREEVDSGLIDHAIRITFEQTRAGYFSPATHWASDSCDPDRPSMGMRLRLRAGYDISAIDGDAGVIARALRDYGAIVADNGSNFFISGSTDSRWRDSDLNQLKAIPGSAFEVVAPGSAEISDC